MAAHNKIPDSSLLDSLLHSLPLNVYAKDRAGRFIFANNTYCKNIGRTAAEILGKTDFDLHPKTLAEKYLADDRKIMETGAIEIIEEKWQSLADSRDGYVQVVKSPLYDSLEKRAVIGTIGIFWDITERKQMEIALAEERNLLRVLIDNLPDYIYVKDRQSRILIANKAQVKVLGGNSEDEVLNRTDFDFFPQSEAQVYFDDEQRVLRSTTPLVDKEEFSQDTTGKERWTQTTKIPFYNTEKTLVGIVGIGHDITQRKKREMERHLLEAQLQQSRKMESVGTLTAGIAHDFNNLLSIINGYSELLQIRTPADHPYQETIEKILHAGRTAAGLVGQLLAFSRKQIANPRILDINTAITATQNMLRRIIGENIEIVLDLQQDLWSVKIDPAQFEQIIINLTANARDAMPFGGKLIIETHNVVLDENYTLQHADVLAGRYVLLSASDNGLGMSKEVQEHIFEPFFTTKEKHRGTGLGMATVFGIVKQNDGHIWIYSEEGMGATFKIYLPQTDEAAAAPEGDAVHAAGPQTGSETILIVEDEPSLRELARTILHDLGYTVITAESGDQALGIACELTGPLHLLLTDVIMPGMSGTALAKELNAKFPRLKVLYMSGYTDNAIVHYGILEPGIEFIQKPFSPASLTWKIRRILDGND
jgi:PAS domain S-box-containing protein